MRLTKRQVQGFGWYARLLRSLSSYCVGGVQRLEVRWDRVRCAGCGKERSVSEWLGVLYP